MISKKRGATRDGKRKHGKKRGVDGKTRRIKFTTIQSTPSSKRFSKIDDIATWRQGKASISRQRQSLFASHRRESVADSFFECRSGGRRETSGSVEGAALGWMTLVITNKMGRRLDLLLQNRGFVATFG
jgi:hypothetical protein